VHCPVMNNAQLTHRSKSSTYRTHTCNVKMINYSNRSASSIAHFFSARRGATTLNTGIVGIFKWGIIEKQGKGIVHPSQTSGEVGQCYLFPPVFSKLFWGAEVLRRANLDCVPASPSAEMETICMQRFIQIRVHHPSMFGISVLVL